MKIKTCNREIRRILGNLIADARIAMESENDFRKEFATEELDLLWDIDKQLLKARKLLDELYEEQRFNRMNTDIKPIPSDRQG